MSFFLRTAIRSGLRALLILGGIGVIAACGLGLLSFFAFPSTDDLCANDNVVEILSPDSQLKALTFRRDCGATAPFSTHVSILPASRKLPNEGGNVFTASGEPSIAVRWIDDHHLSITGETETEFLHLTEFSGVRITYD